MSKLIIDLSHHQPSININWKEAAKDLALVIIRVQYGSKTIDREYKNHVANCKKYGIPFGHYAYGHFVSVEDAKKEARDFLSRIDKEAKFLALDTEKDTLKSCGPEKVAEASQAFINVCKEAGYKTGFYVSHHLYNKYGLNKIVSDFLWIPRYGINDGTPNKKPDYPCCLWQYTEKGRAIWFNSDLDKNQLNGDKTLEWFIGISDSTAYKVVIPNTAYWQAKALVIEFEQRGFKCEGVAGKVYGPNEKPGEKDPYKFVVYTDHERAKHLVIELKHRGYSRAYGEKL